MKQEAVEATMPAPSVQKSAACCCRKPRTAGAAAALQAGRLLLSLGDLDGAAALFAKAEASPQVHSELPFDQSTASSFIDRLVDQSPASAELSSTTCRPPGSVMPPT